MKNLISLLVLIVVVTSLGSCYYENECITGTPGNTFDNSEIRGETETPSNLTTQSQEPLQTQGNYQDAFYNFDIYDGNIFVYDGNVFVSHNGLFKISLSNGEVTCIGASDIFCGINNLCVDNTGIYVSVHTKGIEGIYKIEHDGNSYIKLNADKADEMMLYGDSIYYTAFSETITSSRVMKLTKDGKTEVITDYAELIGLTDEYVFMLCGKAPNEWICRLSVNEKKKVNITENSGGVANGYVLGEWVYYFTYDNRKDIYRVRIDGTEAEFVQSDYDMVGYYNENYYAIKDMRLYRIKGNYTDPEYILDLSYVQSYVIKNEYIILFLKELDNYRFEIYDLNGNLTQTVYNMPTHDVLSERVGQAKSILHGEWELKYYYPLLGFTVYSIDEADSLIGVIIKISEDSVYFDNRKLCEKPEFTGKMLTDYSIVNAGAGERSFEYYGIEYGEVLRIILTLDSGIIQETDKSLYIYIKNNNCLLIDIGGTYYEAIRVE